MNTMKFLCWVIGHRYRKHIFYLNLPPYQEGRDRCTRCSTWRYEVEKDL